MSPLFSSGLITAMAMLDGMFRGAPIVHLPPPRLPSKRAAAIRKGDRERAAELHGLRSHTIIVDDPLGLNDTRADHYLHAAARRRRKARQAAARG